MSRGDCLYNPLTVSPFIHKNRPKASQRSTLAALPQLPPIFAPKDYSGIAGPCLADERAKLAGWDGWCACDVAPTALAVSAFYRAGWCRCESVSVKNLLLRNAR